MIRYTAVHKFSAACMMPTLFITYIQLRLTEKHWILDKGYMHYSRNEKTFQRSRIKYCTFRGCMPISWSPVLEIEASSHSDFYNVWQSVHLHLVVCSRKTTDVALRQIGATCPV